MSVAAYILTLREAAPTYPTLEEVLQAVLDVTKVPLRELYARRRYIPYCRARHLYYYAATVLTREKCDAVSAMLNRDRSTGSHGYQQVLTNPNKFQPELSRIMARFQKISAAA